MEESHNDLQYGTVAFYKRIHPFKTGTMLGVSYGFGCRNSPKDLDNWSKPPFYHFKHSHQWIAPVMLVNATC